MLFERLAQTRHAAVFLLDPCHEQTRAVPTESTSGLKPPESLDGTHVFLSAFEWIGNTSAQKSEIRQPRKLAVIWAPLHSGILSARAVCPARMIPGRVGREPKTGFDWRITASEATIPDTNE